MRRLEHADEDKFWEAWIKDDNVFCFRFGKIGSQGQTRIKRHATRKEADEDLEENVARKLKEGFTEKSEEDAEDEDEEHEAEEGEEEEEEEGDDEDEEDEDEAPKKKRAAPKHVAPAAAEPSKPALPTRLRASKLAPEQISAARNALDALHRALGGRSWHVRRLGRRARQALERIAGADPAKHDFGEAFDVVMNDVIAAEKRLPLDIAMGLLLEVDEAVFVRTVKRWKSANAGAAKDAIAALSTSIDAIHDADIALHVGAALAERRLDASSWRKRFHHVKPALEDALKKNGSTLAKYLKSLDAADDTVLASRIEEAAR